MMTEADLWIVAIGVGGAGALAGLLLALMAHGLQVLVGWLATGSIGMTILNALAFQLGDLLFWTCFVAAAVGLMIGYDLAEA